MGKGKQLIILDIDLKEDTWKHLADRLLEEFKGYFVVKTPNGYHIYVKVESDYKFKTGRLCNLGGDKTTIEIFGEGKKAVGPGSIVDMDKMYKSVNRWGNSLSTSFISNDELISKLKEAGLMMKTSKYVEKKSKGAIIIKEKDRQRAIIRFVLGVIRKETFSMEYQELV